MSYGNIMEPCPGICIVGTLKNPALYKYAIILQFTWNIGKFSNAF